MNVRLNELLRLRGRRLREVDVSGLRLWLDVTDQSGFDAYFYGNLHEPLLTAQLFATLREGDVFVDVGANVGLFTAIAARLVGDTGRVVAFEPHPDARRELAQLIEKNGVAGRVDVVAAAAADREASGAALHVTGRTSLSTLDVSAAPARDDFEYTGVVPVDVTTIDAWMTTHLDLVPRIALVKIDVEGAEDRVIGGMQATLQRAPHARIVCETAADSEADRRLLAAGFAATPLESPDGSYRGNRLYTRRPK